MVGWAADSFGNKAGEALVEGLPIRVGCHNGKEEAKYILVCRWYGLRDDDWLWPYRGNWHWFYPFVLEMEPGPCVCWANALPLSHIPSPKVASNWAAETEMV